MTLPPTDTEPPAKARRSALGALGWGFACALCAGGCWLFVDALCAPSYTGAMPPNHILRRIIADSAGGLALEGAVCGLVFGTIAGAASTNRGGGAVVLGFGGALVGALGGGLALPTVFFLREWLVPPVSMTLLWCLIGFFAGLVASYYSDVGIGANERRRSRQAHTAHAFLLLSLLGFALLILLTMATTRY